MLDIVARAAFWSTGCFPEAVQIGAGRGLDRAPTSLHSRRPHRRMLAFCHHPRVRPSRYLLLGLTVF